MGLSPSISDKYETSSGHQRNLAMSRGKIAAQACHGSIGAYKRADKLKITKWEREAEKKVVLKVEDEENLTKSTNW